MNSLTVRSISKNQVPEIDTLQSTWNRFWFCITPKISGGLMCHLITHNTSAVWYKKRYRYVFAQCNQTLHDIWISVYVCNARTVWIDLEESGNGRPIQSFSEGGGGDDASFLFFTMIPFHRKNSHFIKQVSFEFKSHVRRWSIIIQPKTVIFTQQCKHCDATGVVLLVLHLFIITLSSSPSHANFTDTLAKVFQKRCPF